MVQNKQNSKRVCLYAFVCARFVTTEQQAFNEPRPRNPVINSSSSLCLNDHENVCRQVHREHGMDLWLLYCLCAMSDDWSFRLYSLRLKHKKREVTPGYTFPNPKGKQSQTQPDKKERRHARGGAHTPLSYHVSAPLCHLISGVAVLKNTTFKLPPPSQRARRAAVNSRAVRIRVQHSERNRTSSGYKETQIWRTGLLPLRSCCQLGNLQQIIFSSARLEDFMNQICFSASNSDSSDVLTYKFLSLFLSWMLQAKKSKSTFSTSG